MSFWDNGQCVLMISKTPQRQALTKKVITVQLVSSQSATRKNTAEAKILVLFLLILITRRRNELVKCIQGSVRHFRDF